MYYGNSFKSTNVERRTWDNSWVLETLLDKEIIALAIKNDSIQAITSDNQEVQVDILN